jgi:hypothetical protein
MLNFLQPAATLFIGLALSVYGAIQSLLHRPPASSFQAAAQAMPDAVAVLLFAFGIAAIMVGILMLVYGIKGVRTRTCEIKRAYGPSFPAERYDEYEDEMNRRHPAYP